MTILNLALARLLRRSRPPVWPLRFEVTALEAAKAASPGIFRSRASAPAGVYLIEAVGAMVTLRFERSRGVVAWKSEHASIDDAEAAAMQSALRDLGRYRPRLQWQSSETKGFAVQAEVDLPIWGRGVLLVPGRGGAIMGEWHGLEPWGQPYRSSMPTSRDGAQQFVDNWLAMTTRSVRYYRVFPYLVGRDDAYPAGAARQLRMAEIAESAVTMLRSRKQARTDLELALSSLYVGPTFNWDQGKFVPSDEHPSKKTAENQGFFVIGQIAGAYEIVEYTTGSWSSEHSLGIWKPPTIKEWRKILAGPHPWPSAEATKIETKPETKHYGQLELLSELAGLALELAVG